ncbi:hypothetical protein [Gordonia sp. (in: high G+C Gram-positive bacteria)]|jgi:hypothetical protein|uniref:hypothetical protein n=1 Tax=Gordonia sp. (in: high G+C Gram-positive bacteria) TaxID=84139 RepID=UPI003342030E
MRSIQIHPTSLTPYGRGVRRLPTWFPPEAATMTTASFNNTYAPTGAISLDDLRIEPSAADMVRCTANVTVAARTVSLEATAAGTIGAMTSMLYDIGAGVEIMSFYQQTEGAEIITYLLCDRDGDRCWSYGRGRTGDESAVNALISGANQLTKN